MTCISGDAAFVKYNACNLQAVIDSYSMAVLGKLQVLLAHSIAHFKYFQAVISLRVLNLINQKMCKNQKYVSPVVHCTSPSSRAFVPSLKLIIVEISFFL